MPRMSPPQGIRVVEYDGPLDVRNYEVFRFGELSGESAGAEANLSNVAIYGRREQMLVNTEFQHLIYVVNTKKGHLRDLWLYDANGDGVVFACAHPSSGDDIRGRAEGVLFEQSVIQNVGRGAVSFTGAKGVICRELTIDGVAGHQPGHGFDLESDHHHVFNEDILIEGCAVSDAEVALLCDMGGPTVRNITVQDNTFRGRGAAAWLDIPEGRNFVVRNCSFDGPIPVWRGVTDGGGNTFTHSPYKQ